MSFRPATYRAVNYADIGSGAIESLLAGELREGALIDPTAWPSPDE